MKKARRMSFGGCPSRAVVRQRRHRARRRAGLLVVPVEIHEEDPDELVRRGLLDPAQINNPGKLDGPWAKRSSVGPSIQQRYALRDWCQK